MKNAGEAQSTRNRWLVGYASAFMIVGAAACGGTKPLAPVSDRGIRAHEGTTPYRTVVPGDTLYSIAWEVGSDYKDLAAWNRIRPPYTIKPGQSIRVVPPAEPSRQRQQTYHVVAKGETLYRIAANIGVDYRVLAAWNNLGPPYAIYPGQRLRIYESGSANSKAFAKSRSAPRRYRAKEKTARSGHSRPGSIASGPIAWNWPTDGKVLAPYQKNGPNKGLELGGRRGVPIRAAAAGTVVYQGSGLRGYGQLIIVKHNRDFLSAYAHCDRIYIKEGDVIKGGQKIATMGSSGTDSVKLHFEIRYRGTPVNPIKHLPRK